MLILIVNRLTINLYSPQQGLGVTKQTVLTFPWPVELSALLLLSFDTPLCHLYR